MDTSNNASQIQQSVGTPNVPYHRHNGLDSPRISYSDILGKLTLAASGQTALTGDVVLDAGTNISLSQSGQTITITNTQTALSAVNFFGNGADGPHGADGSASVPGMSLSAGVYTMNRDVFFTTFLLSGGAQVVTNGYQIYCSVSLTITSDANTWIGWNGNNGSAGSSNASGGAGGAGGAALTGNTAPGGIAGVAGGAGGSGESNANGGVGSAGSNGSNTSASLGSNGVAGPSSLGTGGSAGGFSGGSAGGTSSAGTATPAINLPNTINGCYTHFDGLMSGLVAHTTSAASGAGAGGGGGGAQTNSAGGGGGGGGGSGGQAGCVPVYAKAIINNAAGGIRAIGGNGGNGANGTNATTIGVTQGGGGGGGSGGSGGQGGVIIAVYESLSQVGSGSFLVTGGSGGSAGSGGSGINGGSLGIDGVNSGNTGTGGVIYQYQIVS